MQWLDRGVWPGRGVQAGNVTGIIAGRQRPGGSRCLTADYVQVTAVLIEGTQSHKGVAIRGLILLFLCKTAMTV